MSDAVRRVLNTVDRMFDRACLREPRDIYHPVPDVTAPCTARTAFDHVLEQARRIDHKAALKLISAPDGLSPDGAAQCWEFFFDLPGRRAKLAAAFRLPMNDDGDFDLPAEIAGTAAPFPDPDGVYARMVSDGKLLYRQLGGLWRQEMKRGPALPHGFRDSDEAARDLAARSAGIFDTEFGFSTGIGDDGKTCWVAQTRDGATITAPLTEN